MTNDTSHSSNEPGSRNQPDHEIATIADLVGQQEESPAVRLSQRRRWRRALMVVTSLLAVIALGIVGTAYFVTNNLTNQVQRVPNVFATLNPATRPAPPSGSASGSLTFLFVGIDSRSTEPTTGTDAGSSDFVPGAQRSDTIMLVRLNATRTGATVVSIPRDSWVPVPGHGMDKINAAYSYGGPALLVQTVEELTSIRIDHFGVVDFAGFQAMTDAVGGINVQVTSTTSSAGFTFHAGEDHLNGAAALAYVRQRYGLAQGDLDRERRQQNALRALLSSVLTSGLVSNPLRTYAFVKAVVKSVSIDDTLTDADLESLALSMHDVQSSALSFLTAPVAGSGREGSQSVIYLNNNQAQSLWHALNEDTIQTYLRLNPGMVLGSATR